MSEIYIYKKCTGQKLKKKIPCLQDQRLEVTRFCTEFPCIFKIRKENIFKLTVSCYRFSKMISMN